MSRITERQAFDSATRMTLVEGDLDKNDELHEHLVAKIDTLNRILVGILISIATAAVLLAINVVVQRAGGV